MHTHTLPLEETRAVSFKLLTVSSPAFGYGRPIPSKYTCDGRNTNPPLDINGIPKEARSIAIIMDDPDAPNGTWAHWVIWNIPVMHHIKEQHTIGAQGMNSYGRYRYDGPCSLTKRHRYFFKVYALDDTLDIPVSSGKAALEQAMSGHILGFGELNGTYKRRDDPLYWLL